jgi:hypothetical protein
MKMNKLRSTIKHIDNSDLLPESSISGTWVHSHL